MKKLAFMLIVLVVALAAGAWLSGWWVTTLIGVDTPIGFGTWWRYFDTLDTARMQPYANKVRWAGGLGFGIPLLLWGMLLVAALRPGRQKIHGDARFAVGSDIAKKGFFDKTSDNGIVVGKFKGKLMRLAGQQFVILAAPTRSGKGVGVVIPNLLDYDQSMVVLDIKQENFNLTSGWRASRGQAVYLFNPFAEDRRTHRWNPLSYVARDPAFRISDIQAIAAMLYPDGSDDQKFWVSQARNAFTAFALYLFENHDDELNAGLPEELCNFPTLGHIFRLSSGDGGDLRDYLRTLSKRAFIGNACRTAFANLLSQADETFASIMGTFKEPLNPWINPVLDAATSANDFWLTDVRRKKMTIYIGIQPNKLAESRLIVNLFFSQLINVNTKELPEDNKDLKHQCLLLMDEFTSIGKVQIIANAVSYMAGYNMRLLPIIQSMSQLDATYGADVSRTLITNHALQIVYAPREQRDANDYSEMLGYTTLHRRNRSRSHGQHGSVTFSESEERRALMLPQELKAMGNETEILLYEGLEHPVKAEKIRYYKDKYFTDRLMEKVTVEPLTIVEGGKPMKKEIKTTVAAVALAGLAACAPNTQPKPTATPREQVATAEKSGMAGLPPVAKPAPLPKSEPAPPLVPSDAIRKAQALNGKLSPDELKARIFRYIDSLQRLEDTHIDNIQKQLGLVIPPYEETKGSYSQYFDHLSDGSWMRVLVSHPRGEDSTYGVSVFTLDGSADSRDIPCRYTVDDFSEMLLARGFIDHGWIGGKWRKSFSKDFGNVGAGVQLWPYHHYKPDGSHEVCVAQISIGMRLDRE